MLGKHIQVAREVIHEGKSFRQAALNAGYSMSSANMGEKLSRDRIPSLDNAFLHESRLVEWKPDDLKRMAVHKLATTVSDHRSTEGLKAAELIGKLKTVDMFVRNGDLQVGIFQQITSEDTEQELKTINLPPLVDPSLK